jgi:hypothetical protein
MTLPKNPNLKFLLFSVILALVIALLQTTFPVIIHEKIWRIYFFMFLLSFFIGLLNTYLSKNFPENFFQITVLAMILRFIATLIFIGVAVYPTMELAILFIADFFVVFLFYLVFDIYSFLANLRPISK